MYQLQTTFWQDFTIADKFGKLAIKDTFNRAFKEWKKDTVYLTELVMVVNWKSFEWYEKDIEVSKLYAELYYEADDYALSHLKGKELDYYLKTTD